MLARLLGATLEEYINESGLPKTYLYSPLTCGFLKLKKAYLYETGKVASVASSCNGPSSLLSLTLTFHDTASCRTLPLIDIHQTTGHKTIVTYSVAFFVYHMQTNANSNEHYYIKNVPCVSWAVSCWRTTKGPSSSYASIPAVGKHGSGIAV